MPVTNETAVSGLQVYSLGEGILSCKFCLFVVIFSSTFWSFPTLLSIMKRYHTAYSLEDGLLHTGMWTCVLMSSQLATSSSYLHTSLLILSCSFLSTKNHSNSVPLGPILSYYSRVSWFTSMAISILIPSPSFNFICSSTSFRNLCFSTLITLTPNKCFVSYLVSLVLMVIRPLRVATLPSFTILSSDRCWTFPRLKWKGYYAKFSTW